jgi:hypothetical protein
VALSNVQTKEVFTNLVVNERLGDVPPGRRWTTDQQVDKEKKHDSCGGEGGREGGRGEREGGGGEREREREREREKSRSLL